MLFRSFTGTDFSWSSALDAIADVKTANAMQGTLAFVTDPSGWAICKGRPRFVNGNQALADDNDVMIYPLKSTNQITAGYMFFGNFNHGILALFGPGVNILVDPYTASSTGSTRVRALASFDVGVRVPAAFTFANNLS